MREQFSASPTNVTVWSPGQMFSRAVTYGFYPLALSLTLVFIYVETQGLFGGLGKAYPAYLGLLIATMLVLEWLMPVRPEWSMTWHSFLHRDLPMLIVNGATIAVTTSAITALAHWAGAGSVRAHHWLPWWAQALVAILISDFMWYWVHRLSHEARGRIGRWLWKTHVLHHLPEQVYVFMHVVGHPVNSAYVRAILMLPPIALGFSPESIFAASVFTGFQGLMSHFNVDIRAGLLNRLSMGTELHRYHHSANPAEGKNFAAVVTLWDQLFGTYDYHPGLQPTALGVHDRSSYPHNHQWGALLAIPFKGGMSGTARPHP